MKPFHIFLSYSGLVNLITVGVKFYCCTWSHSMSHIHTNTL